jgi:hypothetical protein
MDPDMITRYANCAHMKYICQAAELVHSCEIFLDEPTEETEEEPEKETKKERGWIRKRITR